MKPLKGFRRRLLLCAVLLAMAALLVAGCGEEEKYNKEKVQILDELKQVQMIKVPANLEGEAWTRRSTRRRPGIKRLWNKSTAS